MSIINPTSPDPNTNYSVITYPFPNSWTEEYGLICDKAGERVGGKTLVLILNMITTLFVLVMADVVGRKKSIFLSNVLIFVGLTAATFVPNILGKLIGLSLAFGAEGAFSGLFTILINEFTCKLPFHYTKCPRLASGVHRSQAVFWPMDSAV